MDDQDIVTYWITAKEKNSPLRSWMLINWHQNGRIDACAGLGTEYTLGEAIGPRLLRKPSLKAWIHERLAACSEMNWLIPMNGAWWFINSAPYLATGYLFCVRLPAPRAVVGKLVAAGLLGEIAVYPEESFGESEVDLEFLSRSCLDTVGAAMACLPREMGRGSELWRMLQAISAWTGVRLHRSVKAELFEDLGSDETDPNLFFVMMLLITSALARAKSGPLTLLPEETEEGTRFSLKVSSLQENICLPTCREIRACRLLAESGCLLFDASQRGKTLRGHLCVTHKDFALLGIKTPNEPEEERYL